MQRPDQHRKNVKAISRVAISKISIGCEHSHLKEYDNGLFLHKDVLKPWLTLCEAAKGEGFTLAIASGFRGFERQSLIWNHKMSGKRVVRDDQQQPVDLTQLSPLNQIKAVMRWSALPGASRHHWGTDMDIYDSGPDNDQLQLIPEEYLPGGPFAPMMDWLTDYLKHHDTGFYFPYQKDKGGVAPEPWHLSYAPIAEVISESWSLDVLTDHLQTSNLMGKETVLENIDALYRQFIEPSLYPR